MKQTDLLQFYPEVSHASQYQSQETDREVMMIDGYGLNTTGLSESPIQNGLLSRTVLDYIRYLNGNNCSLTWNRRVTRYNVTLYQLPMSARHMKENGQSLLPTPCASDWKRSKVSPKDIIDRHSPGLPVFAAMLANGEIKLPTPVASQNWKPIRPLSPSELGGGHGIALIGMIGHLLPSLIGKRLHPKFVEWMMGFPEDWTNPDCKLSATQLCQEYSIRSSEQLELSKKEENKDGRI